jgi:hypothetical protein
MRLGVGDFMMERTSIKGILNKMAKNEKMCSDNQLVFILFAIDIFDFLAPEVINLLKRFQKVMHNIVPSRSMNIVFQKLSFAIQKGLVMHLLPA